MPIFPRRVLQKLLDKGSAFLTAQQLSTFARNLNCDPKTVIPWEWELALLGALSDFGDLRYEPGSKETGRRHPDIVFSLKAPLNGSFVADITTVVDSWSHKENPFDELSSELSRRLRKNRLNPNHFSLQIRALRCRVLTNERPRCKIPKPPHFKSKIFTPDFHIFLQNLKALPWEAREFRVIAGEAEVRIHYVPKQAFSCRMHPEYELPTSMEGNAVFRRLDDKASQLRESRYAGPFGIFLCDGGCKVLRRPTGTTGITAEKIISRFLQKHERISFVELFTIREDWNMLSGVTNLSIESRIFKGNRFNELDDRLQDILGKLVFYMPQPETTPQSARINQTRWPSKEGRSFRRRCSIRHDEIRLSARVLLEYLAGRIDHEKFLAEAGLFIGLDNAQIYNLFERWLVEGRLLSEIALEKCPEKDDDWVVLKLSEPDAATSEFRPPQKSKNQ